MVKEILLSLILISAACSPCVAQQVGSEEYTFENGMLVTANDVSTCPYRLIGPVVVNVTEDYGADTRSKIFGKLRAAATKMAADAVVLVTKGGRHMTAFAFTRREYTGRAIRYVDRSCAPKQ
jgi:hypothetical protein